MQVRLIYNGWERHFVAYHQVEDGTTYHQLLWNAIGPDYLEENNIRINKVPIDRFSTHTRGHLNFKVREGDQVTVSTNRLLVD